MTKLKFNINIVLFLLIAVELIGGGLFLFKFYQNKINQKNVLGVESVAKIDKNTIEFPSESKLKHYWTLKPNSIAKDHPSWLPYEATYNYNSDGLNERFDYPIHEKEGVLRIITLGDSHTYGHYVNTADNWTEKLEDVLNEKIAKQECQFKKVEVINLGMPGFDIPYIVERYKTIGLKYDADVIIWFESGSGSNRFRELMSPLIEACEKETGETNPNKEEVFGYCWRKTENEITNIYPEEQLNSILEENLDNFFSKISDQQKVLFFFFEWEAKEERRSELIQSWTNRYTEATFLPIIPDLTDEELLPDSHPNTTGHQAIANEIFKYLKENVINNCE